MDLSATRNTHQFVNWLATGTFHIAGLWSSDRSGLFDAKNQGLLANWFNPRSFKEGAPLSTTSGNIALLNRAPHPNAARVFINWLLSREGQMTYQRERDGRDSLRIDIPKDNVREDVRRMEGVSYSVLVEPQYMDLEPVRHLVNEVWKGKK